MHRYETELIEYPSAAAMRNDLRHVRSGDDVVSVDVIDLGKTLRVTRAVEVDEVAETDGLGVAANEVTGEETQPGEPLPEIEDQDGNPLEPSESTGNPAMAPGAPGTLETPQTAPEEVEDLIGTTDPVQDTIDLESMDREALEEFIEAQGLEVTVVWNTSDELVRERVAAALEAKNG